ncbi:unnamed protein product [Mytilus edulis]|uniref:Uncharacterized protein n=1 Tax=Mytilus edulis TaxID=6550 RepID=A0A8S3T4R6_MYTED|nr:unnamed protein product [Mytilus edulis]
MNQGKGNGESNMKLAQRTHIDQQVPQAQMFNPLPSKVVTNLQTSDSNNCIAVDQTSSQQILHRNQGKGNGESNMKFKVTEDESNTLSNDSKNSFAVREDLEINVHEDKYNILDKDSKNSFAVRIENAMEKAPNSSIQDRHSTVTNLPHDSHQKFIPLIDSSATTNNIHDIILLQEHWLFNYEKEHLKQHHTDFLTFSRHVDDDEPMSPIGRPRGYGGIAILYRKSMSSMFSQLPDGNNRVQAIEIATTGNPTCLINVYLPSRGTDSGHDAYRAALDTLKEIILKHYKDPQDELFKQFCKENGLELPAKYPTDHTYFQGTSRSQIDYILIKVNENNMRLKELIQVKILREGHNTSDHYPVSADLCIELSASQKQQKEVVRTKINWEKVNKDNYALKVQEVLKDRKYLNIRTPYGIDQATNQLLTGLNNALDTCYPRRKSKFNRRKKISWSPKLANAVSKSKKAFFLWKKAGSPPSKDNIYTIHRLDSKRLVRSIQRQQSADKRNQLHEEIMNASDRDNELFFRLIKTQRSSSSQFTHTLQTPDKEASTPDDINELFKEHFANLAKTKENPFFDKEHDNLVKLDAETIVKLCENDDITVQPVTSSEISKLISQLKKRKSGDVDGLTSEHLIYGGIALIDYLTTLINNIFYTKHDASTQLRIIESCTKNDRVKINSKKTEILLINKKSKELNLELFNEKISEKQTIKHLGIERQDRNTPNVVNRISTARATMYSLMGAGLHGINGVNPLISYKLWRTFVIPRMLRGNDIIVTNHVIFFEHFLAERETNQHLVRQKQKHRDIFGNTNGFYFLN